MKEATVKTATDLRIVEVEPTTRPAWVEQLLGKDALTTVSSPGQGLHVELTETAGLCHVQVTLPGAVDLKPDDFEHRVSEVYAEIRARLEGRSARHPLRFWNFVPGIHRPVAGGMTWYEVFNAGRFAAFSDWYQTPCFGARMIAASGVGHRGTDFVVQVLAGERPGRGLENPRQRAAWRYSKRYGPQPPCFARATLVDPPPGRLGTGLLIVAGTASVVGEDSVHRDALEQQLDETCTNLRCLVHAAGLNGVDPLGRFRELRAYVVDDATRPLLVDLLAERFPRLERLELMPADLCRAELLVEVEGVVGLEALPALSVLHPQGRAATSPRR